MHSQGRAGWYVFFAAPIHLHALAPLGVAPILRSQPPAVICRWGALISDNLFFFSAAQGKLHDAHVENKWGAIEQGHHASGVVTDVKG